MSIQRNSSNLHDDATGLLTGYVNPVTGKEEALNAAALQAVVSVAGNLTVNSRDGLGRAISYTDSSGTTYTVTYGNFGPATVSGGGNTRTYAYSAAGLMTGYAAS